ncbi:hypothetical protein ASZ78_006764 [Callipepla squamata]|uniref:Uncharacterized protein n=1 Tax=Callipepla squamata TaxID=9009 RepID=A0A226MHG4_CALSU|nr:hypothetical protein ASZ78_006764 [Callipepla squamata]
MSAPQALVAVVGAAPGVAQPGLQHQHHTAPRGALWGPEPHTRPRRQPAQGAWGPWGPWSACSSSCGDGVAFRARRCLR